MKHKFILRLGILFLIGVIAMTLWGNERLLVNAEDGEQKIPWVDPALMAKSKTSEPLDFLIYFDEQADLSAAYEMGWEARGWFVYETLKALSENSQAAVRAFLDEQGAPYEAFWVQNVIAVQSSTAETLTGLLNFAEIHSLLSIPQVFLESDADPEANAAEQLTTPGAAANLIQVKADQVWSEGIKGSNIVLGAIDTGARFTHEALVDTYRGNLGAGSFSHHYHWWDAVNFQDEPYDDHGHGSHVIGIMAGTTGSGDAIGMAPEADWIACKAISANGQAWGHNLIKCGQFMAAPTNLNGENPNPNLRPQVINNSWGDCGRAYSPWYQGVIDAWVAAGIYPVFASGNASNCGYSSPPGLNTISNPARAHNVTSVGSTGLDDGMYAPHSNWGPTDSPVALSNENFGTIKPEVLAPGVHIISATGSDDDAYAALSGTSMSAPHVAGLVALMWSSADCLLGDTVATESLILKTAHPIPYDSGQGDEGPGFVPNHATGWGEIDALAAVNAARDYCSGGFLNGYVYNSENQAPVVGALVEVSSEENEAFSTSALTDENGYYQIYVNSETTYSLNVSAYGFRQSAIVDVLIPAPGETVTTHFNLTEKSNFATLTGVVTDGSGHGYPLYARIQIETANFHQVVYTNPFDGFYQAKIFDDEDYNLIITALVPGYESLVVSNVIEEGFSKPLQHTLAITESCEAPGYVSLNSLVEAFDSRKLPPGWEVWDHAGTGVTWGFDNPSGRENQTGSSGGFAMVDSDYPGPKDVDTSLVTPAMDFSNESKIILSFDQDFFTYVGNLDEIADVDVSVGGDKWHTVLRQTENQRGPQRISLDISEWAAHQPDVRVRFHYHNANGEWWWQVDHVEIGNQGCALVEGGLLAGFVLDKHSSAPVVGAVISNGTEHTVTAGASLNPELPGGFFWMFQPMNQETQIINIKVAKSLYLSEIKQVGLQQDAITRHDLTLVSIWNHLGIILNNLLTLIWEFLQALYWIVSNFVAEIRR